jgi:uncharacterized membrane protein YqiK
MVVLVLAALSLQRLFVLVVVVVVVVVLVVLVLMHTGAYMWKMRGVEALTAQRPRPRSPRARR